MELLKSDVDVSSSASDQAISVSDSYLWSICKRIYLLYTMLSGIYYPLQEHEFLLCNRSRSSD